MKIYFRSKYKSTSPFTDGDVRVLFDVEIGNHRPWSAQYLAALAGRTAADGQAEFPRFKDLFTFLIHQHHHFGCDREADCLGFAWFKFHAFKADQFVGGDFH